MIAGDAVRQFANVPADQQTLALLAAGVAIAVGTQIRARVAAWQRVRAIGRALDVLRGCTASSLNVVKAADALLFHQNEALRPRVAAEIPARVSAFKVPINIGLAWAALVRADAETHMAAHGMNARARLAARRAGLDVASRGAAVTAVQAAVARLCAAAIAVLGHLFDCSDMSNDAV